MLLLLNLFCQDLLSLSSIINIKSLVFLFFFLHRVLLHQNANPEGDSQHFNNLALFKIKDVSQLLYWPSGFGTVINREKKKSEFPNAERKIKTLNAGGQTLSSWDGAFITQSNLLMTPANAQFQITSDLPTSWNVSHNSAGRWVLFSADAK